MTEQWMIGPNPFQVVARNPETAREWIVAQAYNDTNARLIAAAPELLEALQFYANPENWKEQETGIGMFPGDAEMDGGNRARAAIAKATGGTNA